MNQRVWDKRHSFIILVDATSFLGMLTTIEPVSQNSSVLRYRFSIITLFDCWFYRGFFPELQFVQPDQEGRQKNHFRIRVDRVLDRDVAVVQIDCDELDFCLPSYESTPFVVIKRIL